MSECFPTIVIDAEEKRRLHNEKCRIRMKENYDPRKKKAYYCSKSFGVQFRNMQEKYDVDTSADLCKMLKILNGNSELLELLVQEFKERN